MTSTTALKKSQGGMHKGVQIRCMDKSYITNPAFLEYAHELGDTMGITYQDAVRRGGSTNAGKISLAGKAVPTGTWHSKPLCTQPL